MAEQKNERLNEKKKKGINLKTVKNLWGGDFITLFNTCVKAVQ